MANPDFLSMTVKNVEFLYPKVDTPYRFNASQQRSEPVDAKVPGAKWEVSWVVDEARGKEFIETLKTHYSECKSRDAKRPAFGKVFGSKILDDGRYKFTASRNGLTTAGTAATEPEVVGADTKPLANRSFWTGSTGNLMVSAIATTAPDGVGGIKLLLGKIQVVNPVYGSAGAGFEDETASVVSADPDFG